MTHNKVLLGAKGIAFGDVGFDAQRVGGFVTFDLKLLPNLPVEVTLSAGHQFVSDSNGAISRRHGWRRGHLRLALV